MSMTLGWPQIIYLLLVALSLGVSIAKHGQVRDPYNVMDSIIATTIVLPLLYWGGFFG